MRARALIDEANRLQDAGAFAIVLECIPANVAAAITEVLEIPTIGIGAGEDLVLANFFYIYRISIVIDYRCRWLHLRTGIGLS